MQSFLRQAFLEERAGRPREAQRLYQAILSVSPREAEALFGCGKLAFEQGDYQQAIDYLTRARDAAPENAAVANQLGLCYAAIGRHQDALDHYREALRLDPKLAEAHCNLGGLLLDLRKLPEAVHSCREAVRLKPDLPEAWNNLGGALTLLHESEEAEAALRQALRLVPHLVATQRNLANLLSDLGRFDEATKVYEQLLRQCPRDAGAWYGLSQIKRFSSTDEALIRQVGALPPGEPVAAERALLHFTLGKMLDDCARYDDAFVHYQEANRLVRPPFNRAIEAAWIDRLKTTFSPELLDRFAPGVCDSEAPVFVVGMLRSGTTLVEQILSSHPQAHGCGELLEFRDLSHNLASILGSEHRFPECLANFDPQKLHAWAQSYLSRRMADYPQSARFVVKTPLNFLLLGLIALIYPRARVIHCRRDPLDTCLSCYFQNFSERPNFAYDLGDLGFYYRLYQGCMEHWRQVHPLRMLEVSYEDLVERQGETIRELVDFLDLPWDDRCLHYQGTARIVHTASNWQVRQPLYRSSVGRWKHYERHLAPLKEALAGQI
jgi:tetratricopeptide (TPR) repeat protein